MSKKAMNKKQVKKPWGKYVLIGVIILVVSLPALFFGTKLWLDAADSRKFATLQSDFKKLQSEFNKIDPGWGYREGCTAGGKTDSFKTCGMSLSNSNIKSEADLVIQKYTKPLEQLGFTPKGGVYSYVNDDGDAAQGIRLAYRRSSDVSCDFNFGKGQQMTAYIYCRDSSRSFYYDRTDR